MAEVRAVASLALLYVFRMLGLFMVLPILTLYGDNYLGATTALLGVALGIYGLTQACLQIPLGIASDYLGRKPVIVLGLVIFAFGSFVAGQADSIIELIVGRALQGCGAIASAVMALVADVTSEENRTKAMAVIGASIGLSFSLAMILGPALAAMGGIDIVFYLAGGLALVGIAILLVFVPSGSSFSGSSSSGAVIDRRVHLRFRAVSANPDLLRLNVGVFILHACLMACFVAIPSLFESVLGWQRESHWLLYLFVLLLAFTVMMPILMYAERRRHIKPVFVGAIITMVVCLLGLAELGHIGWLLLLCFFTFFVAFNLLEASLPSLVSKQAPPEAKGTAMGVYATCQFLGAFVGGSTAGLVLQYFDAPALFLFAAMFTLLWCFVALSMRAPRPLVDLSVAVPQGFRDVDRILGVKGIHEVRFGEHGATLRIKVDQDVFVETELMQTIHRAPS